MIEVFLGCKSLVAEFLYIGMQWKMPIPVLNKAHRCLPFNTLFAVVLVCISPARAQKTANRQTQPSVKTALGKVIDLVRPSVVQISRRVDLPQAEHNSLHLPFGGFLILGTGFVVDVVNGHVVTALHVINAGEKPMLLPNGTPTHPLHDEMMIGIPVLATSRSGSLLFNGSFAEVGFTVVARDAIHDIALLKANLQIQNLGFVRTGTGEIDVHPTAAVLSLSRINDGDAVAVSGYPLSSTVLVTTSGAIASSDAFDIKMVQKPGAPQGPLLPDIADSYVVDVRVNPGDSGGPMYLTKSGAVIGVCVSFEAAPVMTWTNDEQHEVPLAYNSGLGIVVPAKYVADLLRQNRVNFRSTNH